LKCVYEKVVIIEKSGSKYNGKAQNYRFF